MAGFTSAVLNFLELGFIKLGGSTFLSIKLCYNTKSSASLRLHQQFAKLAADKSSIYIAVYSRPAEHHRNLHLPYGKV
jgi:hypothetical protein